MLEIPEEKLAKLLTPQGVITQGSQNGVITLNLERRII
jgi:hypothetical protein